MEALSLDVARTRRREFAVLDVRDEAVFRAGHRAGAGNVPCSELRARMSELPPREQPVLVVGAAPAEAAAAAAELERMGFARVAWLDAAEGDAGASDADRGPAARLWQPAPFLTEILPRVPRPGPGRSTALDVAAGAGREAVYLALQGFEVEARDRDAEALARANALAARHGVSITTVPTDLEAGDAALPQGRFDLVVCFRYLHRPLFAQLERALAPGGYLAYETYRLGQEKIGRPRRDRFLLRPGELESAFPTLVVEHYAELSPAGGPITSRLLARKP